MEDLHGCIIRTGFGTTGKCGIAVRTPLGPNSIFPIDLNAKINTCKTVVRTLWVLLLWRTLIFFVLKPLALISTLTSTNQGPREAGRTSLCVWRPLWRWQARKLCSAGRANEWALKSKIWAVDKRMFHAVPLIDKYFRQLAQLHSESVVMKGYTPKWSISDQLFFFF